MINFKFKISERCALIIILLQSTRLQLIKNDTKKLLCGLPLCLREGDHLFVKLLFIFVFQAGGYLRVEIMLVGWWRVADTQCLESLIPRKIKYSFKWCNLRRSILFHITYTTNLQFINVESYDSIHCVWQLSTVRQTWLVWLVVGSFEGWVWHIVIGRRSPSLKLER